MNMVHLIAVDTAARDRIVKELDGEWVEKRKGMEQIVPTVA